MTNFGINGFGRIGRITCRVWWLQYQQDFNLKMINTSGSMELEEWVHLLKYDSNYGQLKAQITVKKQQSKDEVTDQNPILGSITISDDSNLKTILVTAQRNPDKLPWGENDVAVVLESTGAFCTEEKAALHLRGGAKYVIISAPAKGGNVSSSIIGVNQFKPNQKVLSNESCTTNCVAPVAKIMEEKFGIEKAVMTTIHSYTDDQNLHDNSHQDLRRARAAGINIVPTSTGAAVATTRVIPELDKKFDGLALRVPTPVGSLSDMVFVTSRDTTIEEVNQTFIEAAKQDNWRGILATTDEPIVSSDIVGRSESSIVDLSFTNVIGGNLVKILSWYDNEWAYCHRLLEQISRV
ncbi:type I glyceraldehyde-3-phosphate dehydrogenase [Patescibacteria group bacterium]|nr:type I glyceraldehyde-3-phosphate dehydrogenase [Patescibacteria group bacterium]MBU1967493.1 type I glyceraldehyde-3-phosphate dehydrogenase [Patescibacteria group bacterium]MBU2543189.1 type I glyceraldehyde-3-phosphate dehydrogenase [Patescibacteria group bacterium]